MQFSWDPAKSDANLRERGFDFAFASLVFDGPTAEKEDLRQDYGERRILAIGSGRRCGVDPRLYGPRECDRPP